jgi:hypothetical protein
MPVGTPLCALLSEGLFRACHSAVAWRLPEEESMWKLRCHAPRGRHGKSTVLQSSAVLTMSPRSTNRLTNACGSALVAALGGAVLAAFGSSISHSALGLGAVFVLSTALGAWIGRLTGALVGAVVGLLTTAFGQFVGGTTLAIVLTIAVCAVLGGWLRWLQDGQADASSANRRAYGYRRQRLRHVRDANRSRPAPGRRFRW